MYYSITKIAIILCWLSLFAFWGIKIFGGNWFEIMVENENFIQFSNLLQNTWLKYVCSLITMFLSNYFIFGAISQDLTFKGSKCIFVFGGIVSMWVVVNFVNIDFLTMYYGYIVLILYGIIYQRSWKKCLGLISVFLELLFSIISILTRNMNLVVYDNYLISAIMIIDMYIMAILYYLYSNLKKFKKEM